MYKCKQSIVHCLSYPAIVWNKSKDVLLDHFNICVLGVVVLKN